MLAAKLRRWEYSIARARPDQIPETPTITIEDLPLEARSQVKEYYHARDWEYCNNKTCRRGGNQFKLMKCAGCSIVPGQRTIYCSRKYQHEAWPEHKRYCRDAAIESAKSALRTGVDVRVWGNCTMMGPRRKEGLKLISAWAFDQVLRVHPNVNLHETCLAVYCRSRRLGRGSIVPESYQLVSMAKLPFGLPPPDVFTKYPGRKVGVVQLVVDNVYHEPEYVDINTYTRITPQIDQWPWIFATITAMRNYNPQLASYRMQHLCSVVDILVRRKKTVVLRFQAPTDLHNGQLWHLHDWNEWEKIFGNDTFICSLELHTVLPPTGADSKHLDPRHNFTRSLLKTLIPCNRVRMSSQGCDSNPLHFDICAKLELFRRQKVIIEDLTARLEAVKLEYARLETDINTYKASIAPIRRCPDEVLLMIFELSTDQDPRLVSHLLPVCRGWYNLAVRGPRLWNHINITIKDVCNMQKLGLIIENQIETCLQRSGSLPLHINLDLQHLRSERIQLEDHLSERPDVLGSNSFCERLINPAVLANLGIPSTSHPNHILDSISSLIGEGGLNMMRWETLHISLPPYHYHYGELSSAICLLFSGAAPNLAKISIVDPDECQMGNEDYFLRSFTDLSSLEDLSLHSPMSFIDFPALNTASLKHLDVHCTFIYHIKGLKLSRFTHLERLTMKNISPYTPLSARGSPGPPIHIVCLPRLRALTMHQCGYTGIIWDVPILELLKLGGYAGDLASALPDVKALHFDWDIFQSCYYSEPEVTVKSVLKRIISPERQTEKLTISGTLRLIWEGMVTELRQEQGSSAALPVIVFSGEEVSGDDIGTGIMYEEVSEPFAEL